MKKVKSVSTRIDIANVYEHFLQVIANLKPENEISKSLKLYGIMFLPDLLDMDRENIKALKYADKGSNIKPLHPGGQGRVHVMQAYFWYLQEEGIGNIMFLTHEYFNNYCIFE